MSNFLRRIGRFETHHRILFYTLVLIATVFFIRLVVQVYNPNPVFFNLELHHFDYGVILLLITVKLLLFGSRRYQNLYLVLAAISTAFIVDGYLALRLTVVEVPDTPLEMYNGTIGSVVVIVVASTLAALLINSLGKKRDTLPGHKR